MKLYLLLGTGLYLSLKDSSTLREKQLETKNEIKTLFLSVRFFFFFHKNSG